MTRSYVVTALVLLALAAPLFAAEPFQVIVHADNPTTEISRAELRDYFLGRATRWPHGAAVRPIDLPESSPVREEFSRAVLGKEIPAVRSYWLTMVFAGRGTPPVELETEDAVVAAVRSSPPAIGYVSASADLGPEVKTILVTD